MPRKKLAGVTIFGVLILMSSVMHLGKAIEDAEWYFQTYAYLPGWLTLARYSFSWFQRIVGITGAVLVLCYKELGRILLIAIGVFTITTVYWKHPYVAVKRHALSLQEQFPQQASDLSLDSVALYGTVMLILWDVLFQGVLIFYFTRRGVKEAFKSHESNQFR